MCGICGAFHRRGPAPRREDVEAVNGALRHRGPDDSGLYEGGPAVLAMRRLSILDIEGGHQPMTDPSGRLVLVYNGEIYNHGDLRGELEGAYAFRTRSDTEVVLAALAVWGEEGLARLNGMFALSLWDAQARRLLLARDGVGIKPLYYHLDTDRILWASELQALARYPGVSSEADPAALARYLALEYVPTPRAMLRGVRKLEPGTWLAVTPEGEERGRFRAPPFRPPDDPAPPAEREETFGRLLVDAVRRQMVADVPVGVFLSGGLDSSALAAAAVLCGGDRVRTFSIGFREASFDESGWARTVARHLGTEHHEEILDERAALDLVPDLASIMDEPLGDASLLPTSLLCRFTRGRVKVALSGDGGDELFAGYPTFQAHRVAPLYRALGVLGPALVARAVRRMPVAYRNFSLDFKLKRFVRGAHLPNPERHVLWMGSFEPDRLSEVLRPEVLAEAGDPWQEIRERFRETDGGPDWDRARRLDFLTYLRDDLLAKTDRASMAHSLEVRVPLLDDRIVDWAEGLPPRDRLDGFRTKALMKRALAPLLPASVLRRPKKGFGVPLGTWLRGPLRPLMEDLLSAEALRAEGLWRPDGVERIVRSHLEGRTDERKRLWTLMAFRLWSRDR